MPPRRQSYSVVYRTRQQRLFGRVCIDWPFCNSLWGHSLSSICIDARNSKFIQRHQRYAVRHRLHQLERPGITYGGCTGPGHEFCCASCSGGQRRAERGEASTLRC